MAKAQNREKVLNIVLMFAMANWLAWAIAYLLKYDVSFWYDCIVGASFVVAAVWSLISTERKRVQYMLRMESAQNHSCLHCGKNWHTKESDDLPVLVFKSRRSQA